MNDSDLEQMWQDLLAGWDDDAQHRRFVQRCHLARRLDFAGLKYRDCASDPSRMQRSEAGKAQILALALQDLHAERTVPMSDETKRRIKLAGILFVLVVVGIAAFVLLDAVRTGV